MPLSVPPYRRIESFAAPFFSSAPSWREFDRDSADALLALVAHLLDALCLAENRQRRKNLQLPAGRSFFVPPGDVAGRLENVRDFLQAFTCRALDLSKAERQTFSFILENVVDYLRSSAVAADPRTVFGDYRFWIENFFKFCDAKLTGSLGFTEAAGEAEEAVFHHPMGSFSLFPFVAGGPGAALFLNGLRGDALLYRPPFGDGEVAEAAPAAQAPLAEFLLANFCFADLAHLHPAAFAAGDPGLSRRDMLQRAVESHRQKQYGESAAALGEAGFEELNLPLAYLLQVRNLLQLNRGFEVKRLLQKFLLLFPYYAEGHELMGDLHAREENFELALSFYDKAQAIGAGRGLGEKVKRAREGLDKGRKAAPVESAKNDAFYDLNEAALQGEATTIVGRERELRQMLEILTSATRRNLLLVGDRGAGKSTLLRLLVQRILFETVPEPLRGRRLKEINFVALLTGSKYRGQFEEKALKVLQEIRGQNVILVLEDIHLMMSGGAARGTSLDLVNIVKPFLRDNSIQVVATTDYEEYKNTLEKDNSLLAFFQKVSVPELSPEESLGALEALAAAASARDRVEAPRPVLERIVEAAKRDVRDRRLPDSAILLFERAVAKARLKGIPAVGEAEVGEVLADLLNLPDSRLSLSLKERLADLGDRLRQRIIGQDDALQVVVAGVSAAKLGFTLKKNRPNGVFLFIGPTGVGKTETALALSDALYGSQDFLIRVDMSEYMEKFTYSRFVGAAPGYVGYYDSNQLTDKVRQNPYSVILLDEIEKADSQLLNIFLQVFDAGRLTDARGNVVDFSKATVIMTSNIGTALFSKPNLGYQGSLEGGDVSQATLIKALKRYFSPEFLNRIDEIVVFRHLAAAEVRRIVRLQLDGVGRDLQRQGKELAVADEVVDLIAERGYSLEYGARNLARTVKKEILEKLARLALETEWEAARLVSCRLAGDEVRIELEPDALPAAPARELAGAEKR